MRAQRRKYVKPIFQQLHAENGTVITRIHDLLTDAEAKYLSKKGKHAGSRRSQAGGGVPTSLGRTSRTAYLPMEDAVVKCLSQRFATVAAMPPSHMEDLQIVRYRLGEEYKPHLDEEPKRQRTIFAYLKDLKLQTGKCGGGTEFPKIRQNRQLLTVYPKRGSAVMWDNFMAQGNVNPFTLHAGQPVTCPDAGKEELNIWFGLRAY